ncbi:TIGR03087 family PEP-CTERM/XrtA system glycosyltransferase [Erythrobacter sp. HKB08]|uniref:TIGR03087 family PEP-CTERM/XrtA system glycosyltransferase n=1 Tax=Erythrobacter sp. HKB08 TaxID=2502843 RepID=UPI0010089349|nr:TIGR03087 family PEP-CTERM/XrtA system glycosyltransferase [Erythrobacter sp. HKB08]
MGDILFLAHRIPFPPDRGDKIRSHHLLAKLAQHARVHVGCFGETEADFAAKTELAKVAQTHCLVPRKKSLQMAGIEALATGKPVSLTAFGSDDLKRWVAETIATRNIDAIFVFSGQMGQYVPDDFAGRVLIDLCDVDSAKFEAYGQQGKTPRAIIDRREARLLAKEEDRLVERADAVFLVSENEADLLRSRLGPEAARKVRALCNGIDTEFFAPSGSDSRSPFAQNEGPHVVFTGQMDYQPNVLAVERAALRLIPRLRDIHPSAQYHIVGRAPTSAVEALGQQPGVKVWGEVPDVRPFLAHSDAVLAPLTIARGVQNKVLEAMAMAKPVVLSQEAATGIDALDGRDFAIGRSDSELVEHLLALFASPEKADAMAASAHAFVTDHQGWEAMLRPLGDMLEAGEKPQDHATWRAA